MTGHVRTVLVVAAVLAFGAGTARGQNSIAPGTSGAATSVQGARPSNQPQPTPTSTAAIGGRIVAGDTGRPVRGAKVTLTSPALGRENRSTNTNVDGRYEIKALPPGRYTVSVARSGYLTLQYGQRRPLEQGTPLQLEDRQILDKVDFALPRMGVISGRITDELGEPIEGVNVFALRLQLWQGRRQWVPASPAVRTDDAGQYRLIHLLPATYAVMATTTETWIAMTNGKEETLGYAPTYSPGSTELANARRTIVAFGKESSGNDFSLVPGRTVSVSGTVLDSHGAPLGAGVMVVPQGTLGPGGGIASIGGNATATPDGRFTIQNVRPGNYILQTAASNESAMLALTVTDTDITDVSLVTSSGWSVTGTITTEGGAPPSVARDRIRIVGAAVFYSGMGMSNGPTPKQMINDDWTFSISGLVGPSRLRVTVPDGWMVKSILSGDRDIAEETLDLKSRAELSDVHVILTDRVSSVTGQLLDAKGAPSVDGTVIAFSEDSTKWVDNSRFVRGVRPDQAGQYQIKGLPAGDYLAIALDDVEQGVWNDAAYLESIRRGAQRFTLGDGESRTISLKLVVP